MDSNLLIPEIPLFIADNVPSSISVYLPSMRDGSPSLEPLPDLEICAREPIQFAGAIEPHGLLLVLRIADLQIVQTSVNTEIHLGIPPEALLGMHVASIFTSKDVDRLTSGTFKEGKRRYLSGMSIATCPKLFDVLVHMHRELLIIELEPHSIAKLGNDVEVYASLTGAMSEFDGLPGLSDLCQRIAVSIRHVTGFDRVMVYRFLQDDSGSVVAEDRRADLVPFLGLRYPASDIPAQARRLYLLNTLRLKPDVNAQRVSVVPPLNPCTGTPLDMSFCILRAMSPVHEEYLRNMGVIASMSISIVKDHRLWGLIACHHTQPKLVPHSVRITCEVLARVFSSGIAAAEDADERLRLASVRELTERISASLRRRKNVASPLDQEGELIQSAMRADGLAFYVQGKLSLFGVTPASEQMELLIAWLRVNQQEHLLATEQLTSDYPEAAKVADHASGFLSIRIALEGPEFLVWFRSPIVKIINWAGNPEKPVEAKAAGERMSPRLSFELWKQTVHDSSEPWNEIDRQFARSIRHVLAETLLLHLNEETSRLNVELQRSNIELDSFAYSASHDLLEPLRLIRAYTQLVIRRGGQDSDPQILEFLSVIDGSAGRMANLINSLLAYSALGGSDRPTRRPVDLEAVLRWALMNVSELVRESSATVTHDALPMISADQDHMLQVFQNLISNAIKYRRTDRTPHIHLSAVLEGDSWCFSVRDNGQGFAPEYAQVIFQAFKRLHGREIAGSGIGLATCKRIVELNRGRIWAESEGQDRGATFWFTAPSLRPEQIPTDDADASETVDV